MARGTGHYAALREQLIDAAERAIADKGLAAVKARDLAREAGCAVGTIYNVFEHLDALILCVGSRTLARLETALGAAPPAETPVDDMVRLALSYLEFAVANPLRWRALFDHRLSDGHELPDWFNEQQQRLFALIEEPLAALLPRFEPESRRVLARTVFSAVHGIVALGLEEKLAAVPLPDLRRQLAAAVRAIAAGRDAFAAQV